MLTAVRMSRDGESLGDVLAVPSGWWVPQRNPHRPLGEVPLKGPTPRAQANGGSTGAPTAALSRRAQRAHIDACRLEKQLEVTFNWGPHSGSHEPITLTMSAADLAARDPDGTSLLSAKIRFDDSDSDGDKKIISFDATGPGDDEYMCAMHNRTLSARAAGAMIGQGEKERPAACSQVSDAHHVRVDLHPAWHP